MQTPINFSKYKGKTVEDVEYYYDEYRETVILVFSDGEALEIYSEDLLFGENRLSEVIR